MDADTSKIHDILEYMKIWKDIMNNLEIDFVLLKRRCISICNFDAKIVCVAYPAFAIFRGDCYYHRRHIEHTFFWSHVGGFCSQLCAHLEFIKFLNKKLFKSRFFNQNRICHKSKMHYHRRHIEHTFFWSYFGGFWSQLYAHLEVASMSHSSSPSHFHPIHYNIWSPPKILCSLQIFH